MSYLEANAKFVPSGFRKLLYLNWPVVLLLAAVSGFGFLMLFHLGFCWHMCANIHYVWEDWGAIRLFGARRSKPWRC